MCLWCILYAMHGLTCYRTGRGQYEVRDEGNVTFRVEGGHVYGGTVEVPGAPLNQDSGRVEIIPFAQLPLTAQRELNQMGRWQ